MTCWLPSFADLTCWLFSLVGRVLRLFSFAGRVNIEGLLLILVRLLVPVLPVPTLGLLPRVIVSLVASTDFLAVMELPTREVLLRLILLLGLLVDGFIVVEPDCLLVLMELPIPDVLLRLIWPPVFVVDDFPALEREAAKLLALKELPMREVLLWLIRLLELLADDLGVVETDGLLVLMGLAIREVLL